MPFTWSSPNPLTNEAETLQIYLEEIQNAINTLRIELGQASLTWADLTNQEFLLSWYIDIKSRIDTLITDYGYISVIDILGRTWSELPSLFGKSNCAGYELLQDYRDVLDALTLNVEKWQSCELPINYNTIIFPQTSNYDSYEAEDYLFPADLGIWSNIPPLPQYFNTRFFQKIVTDGFDIRHDAGYGHCYMELTDSNSQILEVKCQSTLQSDFIPYTIGGGYNYLSAPSLYANIRTISPSDLDIEINENSIFQVNYILDLYQRIEFSYIPSGDTDYSSAHAEIVAFLTNEAEDSFAYVTLYFSPYDIEPTDLYVPGIIQVYYQARDTQLVQFPIGDYIDTYLRGCNIIKYIGIYANVDGVGTAYDSISIAEDSNIYNFRVDDIGIIQGG